MTFNVISDLHINYTWSDEPGHLDEKVLDWNIFDPTKLKEADYLIIAGDLGTNSTYKKVLETIKEENKGKFKDVLWIKGNHDYYCERFGKRKKPPENRTFEVVDGDVAIFGTTMWTSLSRIQNQFCVERDMNDYRWIPGWNSEIWHERFNEENAWIKQRVDKYRAEGKKVVVVTHHNPGVFMADKWHRNEEKLYTEAAYFCDDNSCSDIKPDLWICGHKHSRFDEVVDGVRYYRNPIGYHGTWYGPWPQLKEDHWYDSIVEIK